MQFGNRNIINARDISYDDAVIKLSEGQSNAKLQPLLEAIVSILFELQNRVKTLEDNVPSIKRNIERLRVDIGSLYARTAGQESTINIINENLNSINSDITSLETKTTSLQSFIETNTNDIATINNEIDDLQGRVIVLEGGTSSGAN